MIKVFLVEDEIVIRSGIRNQIDWEKEGMEFAGEASDGELAYPMIQQIKPDIIITDIKMPFMDGLQLSKLVKSEMPWIKIIVLSGYDEFDYAKEAIGIGITDYLLKPISGAELLKALGRVTNMIYEEQMEKENATLYKIEKKENEKMKQQNFFLELVSKKLSVQELLEKTKELKLQLVAAYYNLVLYNIFDGQDTMFTRTEDASEIETIVTKRCENQQVIAFDCGHEGTAFLIKGNIKEEVDMETQKIISVIKEEVTKTKNRYFIGVGIKVSRMSELPVCYEHASKAFSYRYLLEKNQVIFCEDIQEYRVVKGKETNISDLDLNKIDKTVVESFLRTGLQHEANYFLNEYFANSGEKNLKSYLFCQYITMDLYFCATSFMEELGYGMEEITSLCGDLQSLNYQYSELKHIIEYLTTVFEHVIALRDRNAINKYGSMIITAKEYINEQFSSEEISLNMVANKVNISPSHFSSIFSQETGQNFIEYLTMVRMEKAKELLRCSSMKSSEVGYRVGYKDPHYFSFLFKKTQGLTPKEYRVKGKDE